MNPDKLPKIDVEKVADNTALYTGADLKKLIQKARQVSLDNWLKGSHFIADPKDGLYYLAESTTDPKAV